MSSVTADLSAELTLLTERPYPGLRPFERPEAGIFFGRDQQVDQLLERLAATRFIAVVGASGCGKSSLVRAGLIPALEAGLLPGAGARWRIALFRPGGRPLRSLARALLDGAGLAESRGSTADAEGFLQAALRRGPLSLLEALKAAPLEPGENILLIADQFEEVFRFREADGRDEADAFVALLLATTRRRDIPVHVILTMRSDFLGECARFLDLPEALTGSQFLTPRMTRDQLRAAIEGPARVWEGEVEPILVTRLLNDMGPDPDRLPLMQHALMRLWQLASEREKQTGEAVRLTLSDYEAVGGLSRALSLHADEAYDSLATDVKKRTAEILFRRLSCRDQDGREVRQPATLQDVAEVAGVSAEEVSTVTDVFRAEGLNFLTPPGPVPLEPNTVLDISHESFLRQWGRLKEWVDQEARSAANYRRVVEAAQMHQRGEADLWTGITLKNALHWWEQEKPNAAWAQRYGARLELARSFLDDSTLKGARAQRWAKIRFWTEVGLGVALFVALIVIGAVISYSVVQRLKVAEEENKRLAAERARDLAQKQRLEANAREAEKEKEAVQKSEKVKQDTYDEATKIWQLGTLESDLADKSRANRNNPARAVLLAAEALHVDDERFQAAQRLKLNRQKEPRRTGPEDALRSSLSNCGGLALVGHSRPIRRVALSLDNKWCATGGEDGLVFIWNLRAPSTGPVRLTEYDSDKEGLCFSSDSRYLAYAGYDNSIRLWDFEKQSDTRLNGAGGWLMSFVAGRLFSINHDGMLHVWTVSPVPNPVPQECRIQKSLDSSSTFMNGRWLVVISQSKDGFDIWDLSNPQIPTRIAEDRNSPSSEKGHFIGFSPDGKWIAMYYPVEGATDVKLAIQSLSSAQERPITLDEGIDPGRLAFSPQGRWLAAVTASSYADEKRDSGLTLWDLKNADEDGSPRRRTLGDGAGINSLVFSDNERMLAALKGRQTLVFDIERAEAPIILERSDEYTSIFGFGSNASARRLLVRDFRDTYLWEIVEAGERSDRRRRVPLKGHSGRVTDAQFTRDGSWLVTWAKGEAGVRFWDQRLPLIDVVQDGSAMSFVAVREVGAQGRPVSDARFVSGTRQLVAIDNNDGSLWFHDLSDLEQNGSPKRIYDGANRFVASAFDPQGRQLATSDEKGTVRLWTSLANPNEPPRVLLPGNALPTYKHLTWSSNGRYLATIDEKGFIGVLDSQAGKTRRLPPRLEAMPVASEPAFSPTSDYLAAIGMDGGIRFWSLLPNERSPDLLGALNQTGPVASFAFNPNALITRPEDAGQYVSQPKGGRRSAFRDVVTVGKDGVVRLLDWHNKEEPRILAGVGNDATTAFFSPDGRWLGVVLKNGEMRLWDAEAKADAPPFHLGITGAEKWVFSPDSRWLGAAFGGGAVSLWDLARARSGSHPLVSRTLLERPLTQTGPRRLVALAFSSDSRHLVAAQADGGIRVWYTPISILLEMASRSCGRNFSREEWSQYLPGREYRQTFPGFPRLDAFDETAGPPLMKD